MKDAFQHMMRIIASLENHGIWYRLDKFGTETDTIMITIAIPGERWEIEVDQAGEVYIEKFRSDGSIYPEDELERMLEED